MRRWRLLMMQVCSLRGVVLRKVQAATSGHCHHGSPYPCWGFFMAVVLPCIERERCVSTLY